MAWTQSSEEVAKTVPSTFIPLVVSILFAVFYAHLAHFGVASIKNRFLLIIITMVIFTVMWLLFFLPLAYFKMSDIFVGVIGYVTHVVVGLLLFRYKMPHHLPRQSYSKLQVLGRAAFVGAFIAFVVFLGEIVNPFWGGVLSMFPAALFSSMMVIHWHFGPKCLFSVIK